MGEIPHFVSFKMELRSSLWLFDIIVVGRAPLDELWERAEYTNARKYKDKESKVDMVTATIGWIEWAMDNMNVWHIA